MPGGSNPVSLSSDMCSTQHRGLQQAQQNNEISFANYHGSSQVKLMINSEKAGYDIQWELAIPIDPIFSLRAISVGNV